MSPTEDLGWNIKTFNKNIEQQFTEGMSWENYGEWHIDHKIPLKYNKPSLEEVAQRLHYTDTQSMWVSENMSKICRYAFSWPLSISIVLEQNLKIKRMGNCLSKFNNKHFLLHTPPLTAGHLKKVVIGIRNNSVKYFASGVHRNHGYKKLAQSIKNSLMYIYDRFPPQSC